MSESTPLCAKGLTVSFGGLVALSNVDIEVAENEVVSIIGPNGAGKSTTLNALIGLIRAEGAVSIFGRSTAGLRPHEFSRLRVARTFQDPQLVDTETVIENVMVGGHATLPYSIVDQVFRPGTMRAAERAGEARAKDLLRMVGLSGVATNKCSELSYGARKLIDITRALFSDPQLLLLDEPTSGLDVQERRNVERLLLAVNGDMRVSMLVVEHHMDIVRAVSHRVIALQSGSVLLCGSPAEVLDSQGFRKAMIGGA